MAMVNNLHNFFSTLYTFLNFFLHLDSQSHAMRSMFTPWFKLIYLQLYEAVTAYQDLYFIKKWLNIIWSSFDL